MQHLAWPAVLGVDPRLVLVFELGSAIDPDEFRRSGLRVLDSAGQRVVIAFADDPQLASFQERLDAVQGPVPEGQKEPSYAGFFDAIESIRALGSSDRLSEELAELLTVVDPNEVLRLDVECWHPDDRPLAEEWLRSVRDAATAAGGRAVDHYVNDNAGILLARVYLSSGRVMELAELDVIARIDVLPMPALSAPEYFGATADTLPAVRRPTEGAPLVGIIDSGVSSAHPLLASAVVAAEALSPAIPDGEDRHGHGTMVAALLLHGPLEAAIRRGRPLVPSCGLLSVAVLDAQNNFPEGELWERDLAEAIEWCAAQGATIINLSLGDRRRPFRPPRQTSAAALIDELARRHQLVVVVAAGNATPRDYLPDLNDNVVHTYPSALLSDADSGILDPATAALALTVGGITTAAAATGISGRETVLRQPFGAPGWPSPITRHGPGVANSVKPELVERAGTLGLENNHLVAVDAELGVISARGGDAARLLGTDVGTSFAAPLVARIAALVRTRFPAFTANLVRALILLSTEAPEFGPELDVERDSDRSDAIRKLLGYGRPRLDRAIESTSHRAVLVAEDSIPINGVHIYELPVPSSFFESGGERSMEIALAYDPPVRARRIDYLANQMEFFVVRGLPIEEVLRVFAAVEGEDLPDTESDDAAPESEDEQPSPGAAPTPSALGSHVVSLDPSRTVRSRGTNQLGRVTFRQRLSEDRHLPNYLVVRSINRWDDEGRSQDYAVAVALSRSAQHAELHAELEADLEAIIEVPLEIELG